MKYKYSKSLKDLRKIAETIADKHRRERVLKYIDKLEAANINIGHRCLANLEATMPTGFRLLQANSLNKLQRAMDCTTNITSTEVRNVLRFY